MSPEDSPPLQRRAGAYPPPSEGNTRYPPPGERDYTRPLPPTYRREGRAADPSPSRHSYHDSAYSSHSSHSSDNPAFSVLPSEEGGRRRSSELPSERRPPASTQSSPAKSYSRQSSFSYDNNPRYYLKGTED